MTREKRRKTGKNTFFLLVGIETIIIETSSAADQFFLEASTMCESIASINLSDI